MNGVTKSLSYLSVNSAGDERERADSGLKPTNGNKNNNAASPHDMRCGYFSLRPSCLSSLTNSRALLIALSAFSILQGLVCHGFIKVTITSLERRFQLTSSQAGFISSSYDLAAVFVTLPLSFLGSKGNRPVYLSVAAIMVGCGSFISCLPHFVTGVYEFGEYDDHTCGANATSQAPSDVEAIAIQSNLGIFILGQILHGLGGTILYTVGTSWLDENVSTKMAPVFLGILAGCEALGLATGFLGGGKLLDYWVDLDVIDASTITITPKDPRWVGAWWIGFLISGCIAFILAFLIGAFPQELPEQKEIQKQRLNLAHADGAEKITETADFGHSLRDLPIAIKLILKNPVFVLVSLGTALNYFLISGLSTFLPKFFQNEFNLTPSYAAMLVGMIAVPGAAGGHIIGGVIINRLKLKVRGMLRMTLSLAVTNAFFCAAFWFTCVKNPLAGVTVPYTNLSNVLPPTPLDPSQINLISPCNDPCACDGSQFNPVCGSDGIDYFSPCHAGCLNGQRNMDGSMSNFTLCACVTAPPPTPSPFPPSATPPPYQGPGFASPGRCANASCWTVWIVVVLFLLLMLFHFSSDTASDFIVLRSIPDSQRAFGLGVQLTFARIFGSIPGPVVFGAVIDNTCILWQSTEDGSGSCWYYNSYKLRVSMFLLVLAIKVVTALFYVAGNMMYRPPATESANKRRTVSGRTLSNVSSHAGKLDYLPSSTELEPFQKVSSAPQLQGMEVELKPITLNGSPTDEQSSSLTHV